VDELRSILISCIRVLEGPIDALLFVKPFVNRPDEDPPAYATFSGVAVIADRRPITHSRRISQDGGLVRRRRSVRGGASPGRERTAIPTTCDLRQSPP
jgi:hypothetical protein